MLWSDQLLSKSGGILEPDWFYEKQETQEYYQLMCVLDQLFHDILGSHYQKGDFHKTMFYALHMNAFYVRTKAYLLTIKETN